MSRLKSHEIAEILYRKDVPAHVLANEFDKSVRRIEQLRKEHGQISPRFLTDQERVQIAELRNRGLSQARVAVSVGRATSTVRLVLAAQRAA